MSPSQVNIDRDNDFQNLVRNGLEFLRKAFSQIDEDPKHSIINFYTAVEIFLKAPLVLDHWALVIAGGDPDRQKYLSGDFVSVGFEDACKRLGKTLNKGVEPQARDAFDKIRRHRNRMVHFFHSGISASERGTIQLEQAEAWFELQRFVTSHFKKEFAPFANEFRQMERQLSLTARYAAVKFESLNPMITGKTAAGVRFSSCRHCRQAACEHTVLDEFFPEIQIIKCHVCLSEDRILELQCPACEDQEQYLEQASRFKCRNCDHVISQDNVYEFLDQSDYGPDDYLDTDTPGNCDECQGYHTVCSYNDRYLCTSCFSVFDHLYRCENCGDPMTEAREYSYASGCEHCDGKHFKDD